jgi:hypothetical protein
MNKPGPGIPGLPGTVVITGPTPEVMVVAGSAGGEIPRTGAGTRDKEQETHIKKVPSVFYRAIANGKT